jgi:hypothetical protein
MYSIQFEAGEQGVSLAVLCSKKKIEAGDPALDRMLAHANLSGFILLAY